jgi:hypothetical protein
MLLVIVLVLGAGLLLVLWGGTLFLQGYLYTEPTPGLLWQAPAAAAALTVFLALWCLAVAFSDNATPSDIPYDTLFNFSPQVTMFKTPAKKLWAIKKGGKVVEYRLERIGQTKYRYVDTSYTPRQWSSTQVEALELEGPDKQKIRFLSQVTTDSGIFGMSGPTRREFVSEDGWSMPDYDDAGPTGGPTGLPQQFRWGRFLLNLFFNFGFLALLFAVLWLVLRFLWGHALGLALVLWVVITLAVLPMVLDRAARAAQERQTAPVTEPAAAFFPRQMPALPG